MQILERHSYKKVGICWSEVFECLLCLHQGCAYLIKNTVKTVLF